MRWCGLLILLLLIVSGCSPRNNHPAARNGVQHQPSRPVQPTAPGLPGKVYVQGDSLTRHSAKSLRKYLSPSLVWVSARGGRRTSKGLQTIRTVAARHQLPEAVVVGLGTNDHTDDSGVRKFRHQAKQILDLIGPNRCVVWIDLYKRPNLGKHAGAYYAPLNRVLQELQATHPNLLIQHWSRVAADHLAWFPYGNPHPSKAGYDQRSRGTVNVLHSCPRSV